MKIEEFTFEEFKKNNYKIKVQLNFYILEEKLKDDGYDSDSSEYSTTSFIEKVYKPENFKNIVYNYFFDCFVELNKEISQEILNLKDFDINIVSIEDQILEIDFFINIVSIEDQILEIVFFNTGKINENVFEDIINILDTINIIYCEQGVDYFLDPEDDVFANIKIIE